MNYCGYLVDNEGNKYFPQIKKSVICLMCASQNITKQINNTWTDNKLDMTISDFKKGQKFSHSNNAILINKDCDVIINGQILFRGISNAYKIFSIRRKRGDSYTAISSGYAQESTNHYSLVSLVSRPISCKVGDVIEVCVGGGATGTLEIGGGKYSYITVQEL